MKRYTFSCNELDSIKTQIANIKISLCEILGKNPDDLVEYLSESIERAINLKQQKENEKANSIQLKILQTLNLPIPNYNKKYFDSDDLIGLIGEIISEKFLLQNGNGNAFYIKWKEMGTSKSRGLDLILENEGILLIFECKNPHESSSKDTSKPEEIIARVLDDAFIQNSDLHVKNNIIRLLNRCLKDRRFLSASGISTDEIDAKAELLEKSVDESSFKINGSVTIDKRSSKSIKLKNLESKVHFDKFPTTSADMAIIISTDKLQKEIEKMVRTYCKK